MESVIVCVCGVCWLYYQPEIVVFVISPVIKYLHHSLHLLHITGGTVVPVELLRKQAKALVVIQEEEEEEEERNENNRNDTVEETAYYRTMMRYWAVSVVVVWLCAMTVASREDDARVHNQQKDNAMGIALSWGGTVGGNVALVVTCHASPFGWDDQEDGGLAGVCCQAMKRAAVGAVSTRTIMSNELDVLLSVLMDADAVTKCQKLGSVVPTNSTNRRTTEASEAITTFIRFIYQAPLIRMAASSEEQSTVTTTTMTRQHYFWNDQLRKGHWWRARGDHHRQLDRDAEEGSTDGSSLAAATEWLPSLFGNGDDDKRSLLQKKQITTTGEDSRHIQPNQPQNSRSQDVVFTSTLSSSGGMHRLLHHHIEIPLNEIRQKLQQQPDDKNSQKPLQSTSIRQLTASFLLLIPSDMFVDAEDAFDDNQWKAVLQSGATCHTLDGNHSLTLESNAVIDIELPAFDSPQHAVMVHFDWKTSSNSNNKAVIDVGREESAVLVLDFATKVHLRYPLPVQTSSSKDYYKPIIMVPPLWMEGYLVVMSPATQDNNDKADAIFQLQPSIQHYNRHLLGFHNPHNHHGSPSLQSFFQVGDDKEDDESYYYMYSPEFLTTTVAAGVKDDFEWVATLTVLFSILGAFVLGYETSRVYNRVEST